ncbi:MAG: lysophospholipid acyltransferase family protein [Candidatus Omnitrophica bacterium]|nr:lysophospholipid acyltransferase family protein [Candidatus Omnitrophota bacterium]
MKNRPHRFILYLGLKAVLGLIRALPRSWALAWARAIGRLTYYFVPRQREKVLKHLSEAWSPGGDRKKIEALGRRVFENLAMTAVDIARFPFLNKDNLRDWLIYTDEFSRVNRLLNENNGLIVLTAHLGNWELCAAVFGVMGYDGAVVGRRIYYEPFNRLIVRLRESVRVRTIYRDSSPKELLRVLRHNQLLGMLADQDVDSVEGVFVNFFGRPAYTPTAPVRLALAQGVPILPAFVIREGNRYRLVLEEPIRPSAVGSSREEAVQEFTEKWSAVMEKFIRAYPDQWVWMHDRWKTTPESLSAVGKNAREKVPVHD